VTPSAGLERLYPEGDDEELIVTPLMEYAAEHTLPHHRRRGQFVEWTGRSRAGKTMTAKWLYRDVNARYAAGTPKAFRAAYYEAGTIRDATRKALHKQGIKAVYENVLRIPMDARAYNGDQSAMARDTVHELRQRDIGMVFVDEAGRMAPGAFEGITHLVNTAGQLDVPWPLTFVFVGMHELPEALRELPQVESRIKDTVNFRGFTREEATEFLRALDPFFARLDPDGAEFAKVLRLVVDSPAIDGLPGHIVDLVERTRDMARIRGTAMSVRLLDATHVLKQREAKRARLDADKGFRGRKPKLDDEGGEADEARPDAA
jgi:hypothetical protein